MSTPNTIKIDNIEYIRADHHKPAGNEVIVRTYSAGVHVGVIKSRDGAEIVLNDARRIWSWAGALTLNEISQKGLDRKNSKISAHVPEITILGVIEIIPISEGVDLTTNQVK